MTTLPDTTLFLARRPRKTGVPKERWRAKLDARLRENNNKKYQRRYFFIQSYKLFRADRRIRGLNHSLYAYLNSPQIYEAGAMRWSNKKIDAVVRQWRPLYEANEIYCINKYTFDWIANLARRNELSDRIHKEFPDH